jgi:hypothetical protein
VLVLVLVLGAGVRGMGQWCCSQAARPLKAHATPPEQVDSLGRVLSTNTPPGFSVAVIPYLCALDLTAPEKLQIDRLAATRDVTRGLYGHNA